MISFERFTLSNGLRVLVHEDQTTPMAVLNILYDVGARDEHPDQTGFAHLFEHLMFGGSNFVVYSRKCFPKKAVMLPSPRRWLNTHSVSHQR